MDNVISGLLSIFGQCFQFLIDFKIYGNLSLFHVFIFLFLINFAFKFLFNDKDKKSK